MLKFLTHKLRTHSLNEETIPEKVDGHDSGTESDDEIDRPESMRASPVESACGPTYVLAEPSPVDAQYDHHSSEEELEVINSMESAMSGCGAAAAPEKRTWSQAAAAPTPPSSDEEVGAPVRFRTEPPLEARRPRHRAPSPHRLAPHAHYEASPRKRSRHLTRRQRPCLDFDKMQQLKVRAVWRHHSGDHGGELSVFCW